MRILSVSELSQQYDDKILYKNAKLELYSHDHVGLVGQNGTGKSTLLRILTGEVIADHGRIEWAKNIRIGYLDQYAKLNDKETIKEYLHGAFENLYHIEKQMNEAYQKASEDERYLKLASSYQEQLFEHDFYQIETRIEQVVMGLGMNDWGMDRILGTLSGGQKAKVILAKLLLENPDVLLLDEPTNFLDRSHMAWLADYLNRFKGTFLLVSHDYAFLESVTNYICDIEFNVFKKYEGNYSRFLKQKEELRLAYTRAYQAQQNYIQKTEAYILKNKAGVNSKIDRGRQKQLNRLERMEAPQFNQVLTLAIESLPLQGETVLEVENLSIGYDDPLLQDISFKLIGGQKIALNGFNGIGKTTLIRTILGELPSFKGRVHLANHIKVGYFAQDFIWENEKQTPFEIVRQAAPVLKNQQIYRQLARCGIYYDLSGRPIGTLSGGEQAKVKLSLLMLEKCHFLIMDEPTNHLDQETKQSLKKALQKFQGALLIVSHEQAFLDELVDQTIDMTKNMI